MRQQIRMNAATPMRMANDRGSFCGVDFPSRQNAASSPAVPSVSTMPPMAITRMRILLNSGSTGETLAR